MRMCTPVVLTTVPKFCEIYIKVYIFSDYFYLFCSAQDVLDGVDSAFSPLNALADAAIKAVTDLLPPLELPGKIV